MSPEGKQQLRNTKSNIKQIIVKCLGNKGVQSYTNFSEATRQYYSVPSNYQKDEKI